MEFRRPIIVALILITLAPGRLISQEGGSPTRSPIIIKFQRHGWPCFTVCVNENDLSCCPAYSFSISSDGTVNYEGLRGVKVRGTKVHTISAKGIGELLSEFNKIDFFSLKDRYDDKTIDHSNAVTVSLRAGDRTKSIYIFTGEPQSLSNLLRKIYSVSRVGKYVGRT